MRKTLAICGGGAAGLVAAIFAARQSRGQIDIVLLDKNDRVGKKILATGNGRCNYTNQFLTKSNYFGRDIDFLDSVLEQFTFTDCVDFFTSLGIWPYVETDGKTYPYSLQAAAVLDGLRLELAKWQINTLLPWEITDLQPKSKGFIITKADGDTLKADSVIVALGGAAAPSLGSNGSGFKLLQQIGYKCTAIAPALVQVKTEEKFVKSLSGIKIRARAYAYDRHTLLAQAAGEVLFTDYGLSGIPILQLSHWFHQVHNLIIQLDLIPEYTREQLYSLLQSRRQYLAERTCENFLTGLLNKKLGMILLKKCGLDKLSYPVAALDNQLLQNLAANIKACDFNITGVNGFSQAQVTAGGIVTNQINPQTMESKKHAGLFVAGEMLDIYGDCGGYNLHFAFACGKIAGENAAQNLLEVAHA